MAGVPSEPRLTADERAQLEHGVDLFNRGFYFECHDVLEDLWSGLRGESRDFFQGLIQVAVGYYHLGNANREGARSMFGRAIARLSAYPPRYYGFDVAAEREELVRWRERLEAAAQEPEPGLGGAPPRWSLGAAR